MAVIVSDSEHQSSRRIRKSLSADYWYVLKHEKEYGPVLFSDLARFAEQKILFEDDRVWRPGLEQWIEAKNVSNLFPESTQLPAPAPLYDEPAQSSRKVGEERSARQITPTLKERIAEAIKTFIQMFLYLWLVFGLLAIHQSIILSQYQIDYKSHGLAFVNALIFAKVMLVADDLRLGNRFNDKPLIYPVLFKSLLFAIALICFHIMEHVLVGIWHGRTVAESFSEIGANKLRGVVSISVVATVALVPFFILREISRVMGEDNFWSLFFRRRTL
jgi:GYF domain 2